MTKTRKLCLEELYVDRYWKIVPCSFVLNHAQAVTLFSSWKIKVWLATFCEEPGLKSIANSDRFPAGKKAKPAVKYRQHETEWIVRWSFLSGTWIVYQHYYNVLTLNFFTVKYQNLFMCTNKSIETWCWSQSAFWVGVSRHSIAVCRHVNFGFCGMAWNHYQYCYSVGVVLICTPDWRQILCEL